MPLLAKAISMTCLHACLMAKLARRYVLAITLLLHFLLLVTISSLLAACVPYFKVLNCFSADSCWKARNMFLCEHICAPLKLDDLKCKRLAKAERMLRYRRRESF